MPDQSRQNAAAKHHDTSDDSDQADFEAANVWRLIWISGMQEAPAKRGNDDGENARTRDALKEGNREKAEEKLFACRSVKTDGHAGNPRERCVHRVFVIQFLRRPRAVVSRDDIERHDEAY